MHHASDVVVILRNKELIAVCAPGVKHDELLRELRAAHWQVLGWTESSYNEVFSWGWVLVPLWQAVRVSA